ncbi:MAG: hypothetical protein M3541_12920 [Acidobacteriota bacterium]|nr:hypothetical protein [Acidobacteriota bacterium]MDQ3419658.1 hypothetical protein [Acidobacteriota bacterium]
MALTDFQRHLCRLVASHRVASGESYVAGAAALNEVLSSTRVSRDIDLFHDSDAALEASWEQDHALLVAKGFDVRVLRARPALVEAEIGQGADAVIMEWTRDSAFRFFPLVAHADFGLTLHPFDLATNKVLALVGRLEPRDWVDVITCSEQVQPLGCLAWAACGKDPGFSPAAILEHAARTSRYAAEELAGLAFSGEPPDAGHLSRRWHLALEEGRAIIDVLPPMEAGTCVLTTGGELFRGSPNQLREAAATARIHFHRGRLRGAYPRIAGM